MAEEFDLSELHEGSYSMLEFLHNVAQVYKDQPGVPLRITSILASNQKVLDIESLKEIVQLLDGNEKLIEMLNFFFLDDIDHMTSSTKGPRVVLSPRDQEGVMIELWKSGESKGEASVRDCRASGNSRKTYRDFKEEDIGQEISPKRVKVEDDQSTPDHEMQSEWGDEEYQLSKGSEPEPEEVMSNVITTEVYGTKFDKDEQEEVVKRKHKRRQEVDDDIQASPIISDGQDDCEDDDSYKESDKRIFSHENSYTVTENVEENDHFPSDGQDDDEHYDDCCNESKESRVVNEGASASREKVKENNHIGNNAGGDDDVGENATTGLRTGKPVDIESSDTVTEGENDDEIMAEIKYLIDTTITKRLAGEPSSKLYRLAVDHPVAETSKRNILTLVSPTTYDAKSVVVATKKVSPSIFRKLHLEGTQQQCNYVIGVIISREVQRITQTDKKMAHYWIGKDKTSTKHSRIVVAFCRAGKLGDFDSDVNDSLLRDDDKTKIDFSVLCGQSSNMMVL